MRRVGVQREGGRRQTHTTHTCCNFISSITWRNQGLWFRGLWRRVVGWRLAVSYPGLEASGRTFGGRWSERRALVRRRINCRGEDESKIKTSDALSNKHHGCTIDGRYPSQKYSWGSKFRISYFTERRHSSCSHTT